MTDTMEALKHPTPITPIKKEAKTDIQPVGEVVDPVVDPELKDHGVKVVDTAHHQVHAVKEELAQIGIEAGVGAAEKVAEPKHISMLQLEGNTSSYVGEADKALERSFKDIFLGLFRLGHRTQRMPATIAEQVAQERLHDKEEFKEAGHVTPIAPEALPASVTGIRPDVSVIPNGPGPVSGEKPLPKAA